MVANVLPRKRRFGALATVIAAAMATGCPQLLADDFEKAPPVALIASGASGAAGVGEVGQGSGGVAALGGSAGSVALPGGGASGQSGSAAISPSGGASGQSGSTAISSSGGASGQSGSTAISPSGGASGQSGSTAVSQSGTAGLLAGGGTSGSTGGAGSAGATPVITDCSNKLVLSSSIAAGFDEWDGQTDPYSWEFLFSGDALGRTITGGFVPLNDGTGNPVISLTDGAGQTDYGAQIDNETASVWGGGVELWTHCVDARALTGIALWVRGDSPAGTAQLGVRLDSGRSAVFEFNLAQYWARQRVPFASFRGSAETPNASTNGDNIVGVFVSVQFASVSTLFPPYGVTTQSGAYQIRIDDVGFY